MIDDVRLRPLRQFPDNRGAVLHMLRANDPHFERFGEIYFSTVLHGQVKAWHRHRTKTVNFAVPAGEIRLAVCDGAGSVREIRTGRSEYQLVTIPPGLWYGFQGLASGESLVANCATEPFDPSESDSLPPDAPGIPYVWK